MCFLVSMSLSPLTENAGIPIALLIIGVSAWHLPTFADEPDASVPPSTEAIKEVVSAPVPEPLQPVLATAATGSKSILVFLGVQRAYLLENNEVVKSYQISSGAAYTPTPRGEFQIHKKQELRISSQAVPYRMPKYMAFTPNEAFGLHALPYLGSSPESSWYWQEAVTHIGKPVSHGCIRFLPEEANEIYDWAEVGTPVSVRA